MKKSIVQLIATNSGRFYYRVTLNNVVLSKSKLYESEQECLEDAQSLGLIIERDCSKV